MNSQKRTLIAELIFSDQLIQGCTAWRSIGFDRNAVASVGRLFSFGVL